jgi:hypothetical protein
MAKRGSVINHKIELNKLVKIELETINGKPYLSQISGDELLYIWVKVFNKKLEDLFGITSTKTLTRNVRATYKLNEAVKLKEG